MKEKIYFILSLLKNSPLGLYELREKLSESLLFDDYADMNVCIEKLLVENFIDNKVSKFTVTDKGLKVLSKSSMNLNPDELNNDKFQELKSELITTAQKSIADDGYARMGHVFKSVTGNDFTVWLAYYRSLSAILISEGKYIREPIHGTAQQIIDYQILLNPNYELTEITKATNKSTIETNDSTIQTNRSLRIANTSSEKLNEFLRKATKLSLIIAGLTAIFIAIQAIYMVLEFKKKESQEPQLIRQQLEQQTKILKQIEQHQKGIDSSLLIMADSISILKKH